MVLITSPADCHNQFIPNSIATTRIRSATTLSHHREALLRLTLLLTLRRWSQGLV